MEQVSNAANEAYKNSTDAIAEQARHASRAIDRLLAIINESRAKADPAAAESLEQPEPALVAHTD